MSRATDCAAVASVLALLLAVTVLAQDSQLIEQVQAEYQGSGLEQAFSDDGNGDLNGFMFDDGEDAQPGSVAGRLIPEPPALPNVYKRPWFRQQQQQYPRCFGAEGDWCKLFYTQQLISFKPPPVHSKQCPKDCSHVGVCHADTGVCDCPAGGITLAISQAADPNCLQVSCCKHLSAHCRLHHPCFAGIAHMVPSLA